MNRSEAIALIKAYSGSGGGGSLTPQQEAVLNRLSVKDDELQATVPFYAPEVKAKPNTFMAGTQVAIKDIGSSLGYTLSRIPNKLRTVAYTEFDKTGTTKRPHDVEFEPETEFTSYEGESDFNATSTFEFPLTVTHDAVANGMLFSLAEHRNNNTEITILVGDSVIRDFTIPYDHPHAEYFCDFAPFALYKDETTTGGNYLSTDFTEITFSFQQINVDDGDEILVLIYSGGGYDTRFYAQYTDTSSSKVTGEYRKQPLVWANASAQFINPPDIMENADLTLIMGNTRFNTVLKYEVLDSVNFNGRQHVDCYDRNAEGTWGDNGSGIGTVTKI